MSITNNIEKYMKLKNIKTKSELASGAGLPYMTVANLWTNGADNAKLPTMKKIANFLEVTLDDLVYGDKHDTTIETIAAHHDGEEWTEEELEDIEEFKEILKLKRQLKNKE